jgi:hypothetical protein
VSPNHFFLPPLVFVPKLLIAPPNKEMEASKLNKLPFRRKDLLDLGRTDLTATNKINALASITRYFVPLLSNNPKKVQESMMAGASFDKWMTASDLALAILILEHHMLNWRTCILCQQEARSPASSSCLAAASPSAVGAPCQCTEADHDQGHYYKDGISGEQAKIRFESMSVNFYRHLTSSRDSTAARLHGTIRDMVKADPPTFTMQASLEQTKPPVREAQDCVLHRVFFYMHSSPP